MHGRTLALLPGEIDQLAHQIGEALAGEGRHRPHRVACRTSAMAARTVLAKLCAALRAVHIEGKGLSGPLIDTLLAGREREGCAHEGCDHANPTACIHAPDLPRCRW